jgi:hypothetical protein
MVDISASIALAQNGFAVISGTAGDFKAVQVEYMIDTVINVVNQLAGQSIAALSGVPGTMTTTCTRAQEPAVTTLITITLREGKKTSLSNSTSTNGSSSGSSSVSLAGVISKSESGSVGTAISAAAALNNAANSPLVDLFYKLIDSLKTGAVVQRHFMRA